MPVYNAAATHPIPANSIHAAVQRWKKGKFQEAFAQRARETGDRIDVIVAEMVLPGWEHLRVPGRVLGEGGFGCVRAVSIPELGRTYAVKKFNVVS